MTEHVQLDLDLWPQREGNVLHIHDPNPNPEPRADDLYVAQRLMDTVLRLPTQGVAFTAVLEDGSVVSSYSTNDYGQVFLLIGAVEALKVRIFREQVE